VHFEGDGVEEEITAGKRDVLDEEDVFILDAGIGTHPTYINFN